MSESLRLGTAQGRGVIWATALGSGFVFLDSTVVTTALPAMDRELNLGVSGLQGVVAGYLVVLSALLLLGGSLGDLYGRRRIYVIGLSAFAAASVVCAVAPTAEVLIVGRLLQGAAGALTVPASLAIIQASFAGPDRGAAIGRWTGLGSVFTAAAPFLGGAIVTYASWRWAFAINVPLTVLVVLAVRRWIPESRREADGARPDVAGSALVALALAGITYWGIEVRGAAAFTALGVGLVALVAFIFVERRVSHPLLPLRLFRNGQFTWVNVCTVIIYGSFGAGLTFVAVRLQEGLGYSPLEAGIATLPSSLFMVFLAGRFGGLAQRIGPRWPMAVGSLIIAASLMLFARVEPGHSYWVDVLPGVLVFGFGLSVLVAPLTAAALAAVDDRFAGVASAFNNAASRVGQAFGVALIPAVAGFSGAASLGGTAFAAHYAAGLFAAAIAPLVSAAIAALFVR